MRSHDLNLSNLHHRDLEIVFEEASHVYTISGKKAGISMTGFKGLFVYDFDEEKALDAVFGNAAQVWNPVAHLTTVTNPTSEYHGQTREEVLRWNNKAEIGTYVHDRIEKFINEYHDTFEELVKANFEYMCSKIIHPTDSQDLQIILRQFVGLVRSLCKEGRWLPYRTEWRVWIRRGDEIVAGSIDMVFWRKNQAPDCTPFEEKEYCVVDWKVSKKPFDRTFPRTPQLLPYPLNKFPNTMLSAYGIQTEGYRYILKHEYQLNVVKSYIAQLKPAKTERALPILSEIVDMEKELQLCFRLYFDDLEMQKAFNEYDPVKMALPSEFTGLLPLVRHPPFFEEEDEYAESVTSGASRRGQRPRSDSWDGALPVCT